MTPQQTCQRCGRPVRAGLRFCTSCRGPQTPSAIAGRPPQHLRDGQQLVLEISGTEGTEVVRPKEPVVVGRSRRADVQVADEHVSGRHVRVTLRKDCALVEDLDSTNGTLVNGQRIDSATLVSPGDRIEIGHSVMELRWVDTADPS